MSPTERIAIVTGASRGLGAVIARTLASRGWTLVIGAREAVALESTAAYLRTLLRRQGPAPTTRAEPRVVAVAGDIVDPAIRAKLIGSARELGGLDLLVNNASMLGPMGPTVDVDLSAFGRVMPTNMGTPIALAQMAAPLLTARHGLVVNVTSDAAHGAYPGWGVYGASKAALELLTRTLAAEVGDRFSVVLVDPGDMRTRMHQEAFAGEDISDRPLPDVTAPFWEWLFDQAPSAVHGQRFAAQSGDARWLSPA